MKGYIVCYEDYDGERAFHSTIFISEEKAQKKASEIDGWVWHTEVEIDTEE